MNSWLMMKCVTHSKFIKIFRLSFRPLTWTWRHSARNRWTPVIWKKKSLSLSKKRNSCSPRSTCSRQSPTSKISKLCLKQLPNSEKSKNRTLSCLKRRGNFLTWLNFLSLSFLPLSKGLWILEKCTATMSPQTVCWTTLEMRLAVTANSATKF